MNHIKEAFDRVKADINEIRGQLNKLVDMVDNLAIKINKKNKR